MPGPPLHEARARRVRARRSGPCGSPALTRGHGCVVEWVEPVPGGHAAVVVLQHPVQALREWGGLAGGEGRVYLGGWVGGWVGGQLGHLGSHTRPFRQPPLSQLPLPDRGWRPTPQPSPPGCMPPPPRAAPPRQTPASSRGSSAPVSGGWERWVGRRANGQGQSRLWRGHARVGQQRVHCLAQQPPPLPTCSTTR